MAARPEIDDLVRSQTLYPAELRAHSCGTNSGTLPVWFPPPADSIQLSYGRISSLTASQQLTAACAFSSTATLRYSKNSAGFLFSVSLLSFPQQRVKLGDEASCSF